MQQQLPISGDAVFQLLPQQKPFQMVDALYACSDKSAVSGLTVLESNPLVADGFLQEPGLLENIAQTVALQAGYESSKQNQQPKIGFIAAVKDLKVHNLVPVGEEVRTEIEIQMSFQGMVVVAGKSISQNKQIASCELRVFVQE